MRNTLVKKSLLGGRALTQRDVTQAGGGGGSDDGDVDGTSAGGDDGDDGDSDSGEGTGSGKPAPTQEDFDRVTRHLSNADRKKNEALQQLAAMKAELDQLKAKDLPEAERQRAEHEALVKERDSLATRFQNMARTNAFLMASSDAKITWANSAVAMKAAEMDGLEIDDDGSVPGMADVVAKLVKDHPYLVAPSPTDTKEKPTPPKSGSPVGGKQKGSKEAKEYTPEELRNLFPALFN